MKVPRAEQNWLSTADIRNLLRLAGFEALETHRIVLLPKYLPLLSGFLNRLCVRLPFLGKLASRLCRTRVRVAVTAHSSWSVAEFHASGTSSVLVNLLAQLTKAA
jgi:hypothetical protein